MTSCTFTNSAPLCSILPSFWARKDLLLFSLLLVHKQLLKIADQGLKQDNNRGYLHDFGNLFLSGAGAMQILPLNIIFPNPRKENISGFQFAQTTSRHPGSLFHLEHPNFIYQKIQNEGRQETSSH